MLKKEFNNLWTKRQKGPSTLYKQTVFTEPVFVTAHWVRKSAVFTPGVPSQSVRAGTSVCRVPVRHQARTSHGAGPASLGSDPPSGFVTTYPRPRLGWGEA